MLDAFALLVFALSFTAHRQSHTLEFDAVSQKVYWLVDCCIELVFRHYQRR